VKEVKMDEQQRKNLESLGERKGEESYLLVVSEQGYGKITSLRQYKIQRRGGKGIKASKVTRRTGKLVTGRIVNPETQKELILISRQGQMIKTALSALRPLSRVTQGVRLMRLREGDQVASVAVY
ncbi:hypothetical protein J7L13_03515, partial [bacterium]|nr:hypothetical protein [bacterium]